MLLSLDTEQKRRQHQGMMICSSHVTLCPVHLCSLLMLPENLTGLSVHMSYTHLKMYGVSLSNPYTTFLKMIRKQHFKGN